MYLFVRFFCFFLSRFGITKFVITKTLWSSKSFKTIMVPLHRGRLGDAKQGGPPLSYSIVGDHGSRAGCRRKSVMFFLFVFLSRFGITKFVIMETLWSSVIFKTIMVPLHRGMFLVVHLYSTFSIDPLDFFLGANLYQKLLLLAILAAVRPHF